MPRTIKIGIPMSRKARITPAMPYSSQVRLKFSDSMALARTKAERGPNTSRMISGATNPRNR
jgi:hypothetical protein